MARDNSKPITLKSQQFEAGKLKTNEAKTNQNFTFYFNTLSNLLMSPFTKRVIATEWNEYEIQTSERLIQNSKSTSIQQVYKISKGRLARSGTNLMKWKKLVVNWTWS